MTNNKYFIYIYNNNYYYYYYYYIMYLYNNIHIYILTYSVLLFHIDPHPICEAWCWNMHINICSPKSPSFVVFLYTSTIFCESGYCLSSICILSMVFPVPFRLVWCLAEAPLLCSMQFNISRWAHVSWIPPWWNFMVNIWVNGENPAFTWFIEFPNLSL